MRAKTFLLYKYPLIINKTAVIPYKAEREKNKNISKKFFFQKKSLYLQPNKKSML
jgi:hypothetical protein